MKIAVVSTASRSGATFATLLMGYMIASTQGRTVRLCYTGMNKAIKRYAGKDAKERDATCTISQVSRLLEANAIEAESLGDYCTKIGPNLDVMDSWDESLTEEEITSLLTFTFKHNTTDYVFCDVAYDLTDHNTQEVLKVCDAVVLVSEPSRASLEAVGEMQKSKEWPKDKPCMLLISKYHEGIDAVAKLAKIARYKMRSTCKIHYNPQITKYCNEGRVDSLAQYIRERHPQVIELNNDLKECVSFFMSLDGAKLKWE